MPAYVVSEVEFASMEELRAWYSSADYAEALAVAETALSRRLLFVEGVEDPKPRGRPRRPSGSTRGI